MPRTGSRPLTTNEPSASYLSRKGLARLHDSMAAHVAAGRLPGLITLVAHGDDVHIDTVGGPGFLGRRQRRHRDPLTECCQVRDCSISAARAGSGSST